MRPSNLHPVFSDTLGDQNKSKQHMAVPIVGIVRLDNNHAHDLAFARETNFPPTLHFAKDAAAHPFHALLGSHDFNFLCFAVRQN